MEDKKEDKAILDALNTMNEAQASYGFRVWVGAIFFYLVKEEKRHSKNCMIKNMKEGMC